ncbi:MAG TPA: GNAT family protein [Acidimicrobiales bacterium]|nr:GNAT family protein [Acidimicrobiales bacterium]
MEQGNLTLTGRHVRLEPLEMEHVAALVRAAGESRATYGYSVVPEGEDAMRAYVEAALAARAAGEHVPFATVRATDGTVIGSTRFSDVAPWVWPAGSAQQREGRPDVAEIGHTWLAASAQRTGVNTEAKWLMLRHAFEVWEVHLVRLRSDRRNLRSRAAIERLGARFEGVRRADRPGVDGTVRDSAFYSITRDEWPAVRDRLKALLGRGARA